MALQQNNNAFLGVTFMFKIFDIYVIA